MKGLISGLLGLSLMVSIVSNAKSDERLAKAVEKTIDSVVIIEAVTSTGKTFMGSGVILTEDGYIITNKHVVEGGLIISVEYHDTTVNIAEVVATSPTRDLAVLKVNPFKKLKPTLVGISSTAKVGEDVFIIGNPKGIAFTVTSGIISKNGAITDDIDDMPGEFIQTDAAINHGNSGGGLFNIKGEFIGMPTFIITDGKGTVGLGFAISSDEIIKELSKLLRLSK